LDVHRAHLHEGRARGRHESEEHEDEDLAQAVVAVRMLATRVEVRRDDTHRPYREQQVRAAQDHDDHAGDGGEPEEHQRDGEHRAWLRGTRSGEPRRPHAISVSAADAVGVVVRVVHADLQSHRDGEAQQDAHPVPPGHGQQVGRTASERDRGHRERQRADARPTDPVAEGRLAHHHAWLLATGAPALRHGLRWRSGGIDALLNGFSVGHAQILLSGWRVESYRADAAGPAPSRAASSASATLSGLPLDSSGMRSIANRAAGRAAAPSATRTDERTSSNRAPEIRTGRPAASADSSAAKNTTGTSPHCACGARTTTASESPGRPLTTLSTAASDTFTPPDLITASSRPVTVRMPSFSWPESPVRYQRWPRSSRKVRRVSSSSPR